MAQRFPAVPTQEPNRADQVVGHAWVEHGGLPLHEPAGMMEQLTDASAWLNPLIRTKL
ncbi:MAG: hypothetical protein ABI759_05965 [Candidatus Solibacter sp.]